jgi:hypothetical protein
MNLEQTAASLLEQFPADQRTDVQKQERLLERFGRIAFGGFGLIVVVAIIGLIYTIITKFVLTGTNIWAGILLAAFIAFAGLTLAYVVLNESLKAKRGKPDTSSPELEPDASATDRLLGESHFEPAVSVTEDTTHRLTPETISKTRKL